MNAYELADELEDVDAPRYREIAANMLRQQADRIAELEKESANLEDSLKNALIFIDNAKQSEPVAWIKQGKYGYPMLVFNGVFKYDSIVVKQPDIPLYTTPQTKPLLVKVVKNHIEDLWNCIKLFRSWEMDNTANEMEVAIKELEDAISITPQIKPLSDEEILEIAGKYWVNRLHYALYFARAIEAKVRGQ